MVNFSRIILATASAASIMVLGGCAVPTSLPTSLLSQPSSVTSAPPATSADDAQAVDAHSIADRTIGEVLEIGKYFPEQQGQELFHPCRDVTKEQWESLGLEVDPYDPQKDVTALASTLCQPRVKGDSGPGIKTITITADYFDINEALKYARRQDRVNVKRPDYVYFYTAPKDDKNACSAATVTNQGRVAVQATEIIANETPPMDRICQQAWDIMQKLFQLPVHTSVAPAPPIAQSTSESPTPPDPAATPAAPAAPATPEPSASTSESAPAGPTFGDKLRVGTFRITDTTRKIFNPCVEITQEQWRSLNLKVKEEANLPGAGTIPEGQSNQQCFLQNNPGGGEATEKVWIDNSYLDYALQMNSQKLVVNVKVNKPDYVYLYELKSDTKDNMCSAGVVTNRGRVGVTAQVRNLTGPQPTKDQACQRAVDRLLEIGNLKAEKLENPLHM